MLSCSKACGLGFNCEGPVGQQDFPLRIVSYAQLQQVAAGPAAV